MPNLRFSLIVIFCFILSQCAAAEPALVYAVHPEPTVSLNGEWRFRYVPGANAGSDESFHELDFKGLESWKTIPVPSNWEMQGVDQPHYATAVPAGLGLYRRSFRVPSDWRGQKIYLRFDGVLYGFEAWVNGKSIGSWESGYNAVTFDITDALASDRGGENSLAGRVTTRAIGWEVDFNDDLALFGIFRDGTLFSAPANHFDDFTTRTTVDKDRRARIDRVV